ncbi:hypothetical protein ABZ897_29500 [Nonomuraea sp. NPDC046802]|uniref:hypothetical protein n=1 Tax=Nonomuraea sp. NPDC046802 TaxID=3154919 RepID=UPI00340A90CB
MLKRRVAIVITSAMLGLAGMAGSALADDGVVRVHPDRGHTIGHGGKLKCWMADGKVVRFSKAKAARFVEKDFIEPGYAESVTEGGVTTVPADRLSMSLPTKELGYKVSKRWKHRRVIQLTCVWDGRAYR